MRDKDPIYKRFWKALTYEVETNWKRQRSSLAAEIGIKPSSLTAILNADTKAKYENREALAKACGYEYEDFLAFGESLCQPEQTSLPEKNSEPESGTNLNQEVGDSMTETEKEYLHDLKNQIAELKVEKQELKNDLKELYIENRSQAKQLLGQKRELINQKQAQIPATKKTAS